MLRAAAHRLHRCPHVSIFGKQIPPCGHEIVAAHAAAVIDRRRSTVEAVADDVPPDEIAVPADHRMGAAEFRGFRRKQRGVDTAKDHPATYEDADAVLHTALQIELDRLILARPQTGKIDEHRGLVTRVKKRWIRGNQIPIGSLRVSEIKIRHHRGVITATPNET